MFSAKGHVRFTPESGQALFTGGFIPSRKRVQPEQSCWCPCLWL